MSCLGQCGDCNCDEIDICEETEERHKKADKKLQVIKDYACLLANTTCINLAKRVGQYAYFLWCFLRDLYIMIKNTNKRIDNLCEVVKCQDAKIEALSKLLAGDISESVDFTMKSGGTLGADGNQATGTSITTDNQGNFAINWNMVTGNVEVGKGVINGIVNHKYTQNDDGTITANIESFTLKDVNYTLSGGQAPDHVASFTVYDRNGREIWKKGYDPAQAWSESIGITAPIGETVTLQPKGGSSGDIAILSTLDKWQTDDTKGNITANYTNNNSGVVVSLEPCNIKCGACENKEE